jgi:ABC-type nitrate/sulfonate/bicarbonate transport system permease component
MIPTKTTQANSQYVSFGVVLLAAVVWEIVARTNPSTTFPPFSAVAGWIWSDLQLLALCAVATTSRAISGLLLATLTGGGFGILMAMSRRLDRIMSPIVNFLRPLPSSALILLFAIWFGLSSVSLLVVWFGCIWPILISTRDEMRTLPREIHETLSTLGVPKVRQLSQVYSRALLPGILSGVRVSLSIAVILAITVELIIPPGSFWGLTSSWKVVSGPRDIPWALGSYLQRYYEQGHTTAILAAVVVSGLVGVMCNSLYHVVYVHLLRRNNLLEEDQR